MLKGQALNALIVQIHPEVAQALDAARSAALLWRRFLPNARARSQLEQLNWFISFYVTIQELRRILQKNSQDYTMALRDFDTLLTKERPYILEKTVEEGKI